MSATSVVVNPSVDFSSTFVITSPGRNPARVIIPWCNNHTHAVVLPALIFPQQGKLSGIEEIRVGIEHPQHARNGALINRPVHIHGFCVIGLNNVKNRCKTLDRGPVIVCRGGGGADRWSVNAAKDGG